MTSTDTDIARSKLFMDLLIKHKKLMVTNLKLEAYYRQHLHRIKPRMDDRNKTP